MERWMNKHSRVTHEEIPSRGTQNTLLDPSPLCIPFIIFTGTLQSWSCVCSPWSRHQVQPSLGKSAPFLLPIWCPSISHTPTPIHVVPHTQIPSGENERVVGYEDPGCHQVFWFKIRAGDLAYVPKLDKYFRLQKVIMIRKRRLAGLIWCSLSPTRHLTIFLSFPLSLIPITGLIYLLQHCIGQLTIIWKFYGVCRVLGLWIGKQVRKEGRKESWSSRLDL